MEKYILRKNCIWCGNKLNKTYFEKDYDNYTGHYAVEKEYKEEFVKIPFNICVCDKCKTAQLKYLGDVKEIYKVNHADSTGKVMQAMHDNVLNFISEKANTVNGIVEIGSSKGVLADKILDKIKTEYTIIEPSYFGSRDNKIIIEDFYENVDDSKINANTIIISHVLEHFYEPIQILKKIFSNKNIENFFLVFPDFEYYINNKILHCLNIEHTFYVDTRFLESIFNYYGFDTIKKSDYEGHSVVFYFKRNKNASIELLSNEYPNISQINSNYNLDKFYGNIFNTISEINKILTSNKDKNIYLFPASNHSIYLAIFGLHFSNLKGLVDNSKLKIGKVMYGLKTEIYSFEEVVNSADDSTFLILNGGVFNKEIETKLLEKNIKYYKCS